MDGWLAAFATSTVLVAVAEIGDKTQLLSFALAARYRKPWTIVAAILVATLANHALAGSAGVLIAQWLQPRTAALPDCDLARFRSVKEVDYAIAQVREDLVCLILVRCSIFAARACS